MNLYFVQAEYPTSGDGGINMDLFVWAATPENAILHWRAHFVGWDNPNTVKVWTVPTGASSVGAVEWIDMYMVEVAL